MSTPRDHQPAVLAGQVDTAPTEVPDAAPLAAVRRLVDLVQEDEGALREQRVRDAPELDRQRAEGGPVEVDRTPGVRDVQVDVVEPGRFSRRAGLLRRQRHAHGHRQDRAEGRPPGARTPAPGRRQGVPPSSNSTSSIFVPFGPSMKAIRCPASSTRGSSTNFTRPARNRSSQESYSVVCQPM